MFCSQCGTRAKGNFCSQCGNRLRAPAEVHILSDQDFLPRPVSWEFDCRYDVIMRTDAVRRAITRHAAAASKGISGEAMLAVYDGILASVVPLASLAPALQSLYGSWGIGVSRERSERIDAPIGRTMARVLCSLAKRNQAVQQVQQLDCGCIVTAVLPSSVCALQGHLTVGMEQVGQQTRIIAATSIPGQLYDWGKSQRALNALFQDMSCELETPGIVGHLKSA